MKIKDLLLSLILMTLLVVVLAACTGETVPPANAPAANNAAEPMANNTEENTSAPENLEQEPEAEPTTADEQTAPEEQPAESATVSFSADVQPILESRCLNCHGGERVEGELIMRTYTDLMAGGESGQVVIPGDVEASYLAELILEQEMPKRGPKLTPVQTDTIITWISEGALNN